MSTRLRQVTTLTSGVDLHLAHQLERAEGLANAAYVDARREVQPEVGAGWIEDSGVLAMFDGVGSPITQTLGLGLDPAFHPSAFERLEGFFQGPRLHHGTGGLRLRQPGGLRPAQLARLLADRGVGGARSSHCSGDLDGDGRVAGSTGGRRGGVGMGARRGQGLGSESPELASFVEDFGRVIARAQGVHCFLAELDGVPIAAGALNISNGVALLAGASTIPAARRLPPDDHATCHWWQVS